MTIIDALLTKGATHGRTGNALIPRGIVIHWVANPNSKAINNRDYFERGADGNYTSAHYIIDIDGTVVRCIPENECAQHAGKSYGKKWDDMAKTNNSRYIGIECCHPDSKGKFSEKTYAALIELSVDILKRHRVPEIHRHYDVTGKYCPKYYCDYEYEWDKLKKVILNKLYEITKPAEEREEFELKYNTVNDCPAWAQFTIKKLISKGFLKGDGKDLDLSMDMIRVFVVLDQAGIFG